jgi:hypothetical protein
VTVGHDGWLALNSQLLGAHFHLRNLTYRNRVYPHIVTVLGNPKPIQKIRQQIIPLA